MPPFSFFRALFSRFRTVILYFCIGVSAALVDVGLYVFLFNALDIRAVLATTLSVSVATVYAFLLNAYFNFQKTDYLLGRLLSYGAVSGIGLIISAGFLYVFHDQYGYDGNLVKIASLPVIFVVQYILNKHITFQVAPGRLRT